MMKFFLESIKGGDLSKLALLFIVKKIIVSIFMVIVMIIGVAIMSYAYFGGSFLTSHDKAVIEQSHQKQEEVSNDFKEQQEKKKETFKKVSQAQKEHFEKVSAGLK